MIRPAFFLVALGLAVPVPAAAQVTVNVEPIGGAEFAEMLGISLADLETRIQGDLEELFNVLEPKKYLEAFADAEAFSSKGLGADYASNFDIFSIGFAINATLAVGDEGFRAATRSERPVVGVAPNLGVLVGVNLGALVDGLKVYANGFHRNGSFKDFDLKISNFGLHAQYKLLDGNSTGSMVLGWSGLDITTGFEFGHLELELGRNLQSDLDVTDDGVDEVDIRLDSVGKMTLSTNTYAIPFELTTGLKILSLATVYGGAGIDIVSGKSDMDVDLDSTLTGIRGGAMVPLGAADITVKDSNGPSTGRLRFLLGVQANILAMRVFLQANLAPDRTVGGTFGLRFAW